MPEEYRRLFGSQRLPRVLLPSGKEAFLAGRYDDVRAVLSGPVSADGATPGFPMARGGPPPTGKTLSFFRMDGADHRQYRKLAAADFTVAQVNELRPTIQAVADELVGQIRAASGPVDLVTALALPLPIRVICQILGVPADEQEYFHGLSDILTRGPQVGREVLAKAVTDLHAYIGQLAANKRTHPGEDLITRLVQGFDADPGLDQAQLPAIVLLLLVAGHEMIASTIALGALAVMTDPAVREAVLSDPKVMPNLAEELLRYTSVTNWIPRAVVGEMRIGEEVMRPGDGVIILPAVGNRDPDVFADPDRVDPWRANADRHLAFGFGPHQCLGSQLARAELEIVLETLFRTLPEVHHAVPVRELVFKQQAAVYGVEELPVTAGKAAG